MKLRTTINKWISEFKNFYLDGWSEKSYSQEGEDMILKRIFETKQLGFFIDVGAHHPKRFSNTYYFYKRGWAGINIDAMPGSMRLFNKYRPRDINLECGIGNNPGYRDYYIFNEPALNGFSKELSEDIYNKHQDYEIVNIIQVEIKSLESVLNDNVQPNQALDFLTIDAEGFDLDVLHSNNWSKYRPQYVLVEELDSIDSEAQEGSISKFMYDIGYKVCAKSVNTIFFKNNLF